MRVVSVALAEAVRGGAVEAAPPVELFGELVVFEVELVMFGVELVVFGVELVMFEAELVVFGAEFVMPGIGLVELELGVAGGLGRVAAGLAEGSK